MVEYAVLVAHNTANFFTIAGNDAYSWASELDWEVIGYVAAVVVFLRLAIWAFKPATRY